VQEYQGRVAAEERRLATSGEEYTDEDMSLARLDAGLYTLQQVGATRMFSICLHASSFTQHCVNRACTSPGSTSC
jgi:hypothetical protein